MGLLGVGKFPWIKWEYSKVSNDIIPERNNQILLPYFYLYTYVFICCFSQGIYEMMRNVMELMRKKFLNLKDTKIQKINLSYYDLEKESVTT